MVQLRMFSLLIFCARTAFPDVQIKVNFQSSSSTLNYVILEFGGILLEDINTFAISAMLSTTKQLNKIMNICTNGSCMVIMGVINFISCVSMINGMDQSHRAN